MISKEVIFDRLRQMNPGEVASIVRNALMEANIEDDSKTSGIYFESLLSNSNLQEGYAFIFSAEEHSVDMAPKKYLGADTQLDDGCLFEFDSSFRSIISENDCIVPAAA